MNLWTLLRAPAFATIAATIAGTAWLQVVHARLAPGHGHGTGETLDPMLHLVRDGGLAIPLALLVTVLAVYRALTRGERVAPGTAVAAGAFGATAAFGIGAPVHSMLFEQAAGVTGPASMARHALAQVVLALPVTLPAAATMLAAAVVVHRFRHRDRIVRRHSRLLRATAVTAGLAGVALAVPIGPVTPTASAATGVCPAGARPVLYDLAAFRSVIPLNGWGDKIPNGMVYALKSRKAAIEANPNLVQPLVIRANVGDCISVRLRNDIAGRRIGIHPEGLVRFDPITSDGAAIGRNPDTTVATGQERTYTWYADRVGEAALLDLANLDDASSAGSSVAFGLYGAVVVHPTGTRWRNQITGADLLGSADGTNVAVDTQVYADVVNDPLKPAFRSFVMVLLDENEHVVDRNGRTPTNPLNGQPESTFGINYRSEPLRNRLRAVMEYRAGKTITLPNGRTYDPRSGKDHFCDGWDPNLYGAGLPGVASPDGVAGCIGEESFLQAWVFGDEGKLIRKGNSGEIVVDSDLLIPKAYKGDPVRFSVVHPGAKETHPWHQHTHRWLADPDNPNSPRNDVQAVGPGEAYPLVLEKGAGGVQSTIGDSIFHCHLYPHFSDGMWGHLRVFDRLRDGTALMTRNKPVLFNGVPSNRYPDGTPIEPLRPLPGNTPPSVTATQPGYPLFVNGVVGQRAYRPPYAVVADTFRTATDAKGVPLRRPGDTVRTPTALETANLPALSATRPGAAFIDPCPSGAPVRTYNPQAIDVPIVYNDAGWNDPEGRIYVEGDAGRQAVLSGRQPEPLTIRSRVGECVNIRLTNNTHLDDDPSKPIDVLNKRDGIFQSAARTSELSTHVHLVEFDELGSDGTSVGWNYVQAAMPGQTYGYRWFVDTALRTVFFHDHQYAASHQQKGLYAAMNVEPADATWHDPATGAPTNGVGTVADIRSPSGPDFREITVFQQDRSPMWKSSAITRDNAVNPPTVPDNHGQDQGGYAINYRNEPFQIRTVAGAAGPVGDPAYVYSSVVHGDPSTPVFRAYTGDPVIIRSVVGAHEEVHTFGLHGHRWLSEPDNPLSTMSDNQGMALAEWFNFEISGGKVVRRSRTAEETRKQAANGAENGTPKILSGGAGGPGDYRYGSTALDDQWLGNWGIFRVSAGKVGDLQPLADRKAPSTGSTSWPALAPGQTYDSVKTAAPTQQSSCPAGAPLRSYAVDAITRDIVYDPRTGDHDPNGLQYVLAGSTVRNPGPLFLRANAGDCVQVTLTNKIGTWNGNHTGDVPLPASAPFPWGRRVGMTVGLVDSDVTRNDGAAVGYNFDSTVAPGGSITYFWSIPPDLGGSTANIIDLGDRRGHVHHGLFGGLLIEPAGSTWTDPVTGAPVTTADRADITWTDSSGVVRRQREFVIAFQDGLNLRTKTGAPIAPASEVDDPYELGNRGINYRTARLATRSKAGSTFAMSSLVNGDPATPVFLAHANDPVQLRVLQSSDRGRAHTFVVSGHGWNYQPRDPNSSIRSALGTVLSGRSFSVWLRGGAGGPTGITGDYLFRDGVQPNQVNAGLWGLLRVLPTSSTAIRRL
jgi:hypothetical protein